MTKYMAAIIFLLCCLHTNANEKVLNIGILHPASSFNPAQLTTVREVRVVNELYEGLLTIDQKGSIIPGLAISWEVDEKGTKYTFKLRDDLFWSDGHPLTSMDFVDTFRAAVKYKTKTMSGLRILKNFDAIQSGTLPFSSLGVYALDKKNLILELESALAFFDVQLLQAEFRPLPMHKIKEESIVQDWDVDGKIPVSGPYQFSGKGELRLTFTKNPYYHSADSVNFDTLIFTHYENEGHMVNDLVKNKINVGEIGSNSRQLTWLHKNYPDSLKYVEPSVLTYLAFNNNDSVVSNIDIRKALAMSIDKSILAQALTDNFVEYKEAQSVAPPNMYKYAEALPMPQWNEWQVEKRREQAIQLLESAGYSIKNKLEISLHVDSRANRIKTGKLIQGMWNKIGVKTNLKILPTKQHYDDMDQNKLQIALSGWTQDFPEPYNFLTILHADFLGETPIESANIESLMGQALSTLDDIQREAIYLEIEKTNQDRVIKLPLTFSRNGTLISPKLAGYEYTGSGDHLARWMYLKEE